MKATELRIGNWVEIQGLQSKVILVDVEECICENEYCEDFENNKITQNLQPIPLTEEWLDKFGSDSVGCIKLPTGSTLQITMNKYGCVIWNGNLSEFVELGDCKHVHQLQNLYFVLTGEELNQRR